MLSIFSAAHQYWQTMTGEVGEAEWAMWKNHDYKFFHHPFFCLLYPSLEWSKSQHITITILDEDCSWQLLSSLNSFTYKAVYGRFCSIVLCSCVEKRSRALRVRSSTLSHPRSHRRSATWGRIRKIIKVQLYEEIGAWYHHGRTFNQTAPSPQHLRRGVGSAARLQRRLGCTSLRTDHLTRRLATCNVVLCDCEQLKFTLF